VGYLSRYYDPALELPETGAREEWERRQIERLERALSVVIMAGTIPRRLGGDANDDELALDRRRAKRAGHALSQSLKGWTKNKPNLPLNDDVRMAGAQIVWETWRDAHLSDLNLQLRSVTTWAIKHDELDWGKSAVVKLENEINWVGYALRE
jgi:hypothetical protein